MKATKQDLLNTISYSRLHKGYLTDWDIMLVHQHINLGKELPQHIKEKIETIINLINQTKWERPILRIGTELQTEVFNKKTGAWEKYIPPTQK